MILRLWFLFESGLPVFVFEGLSMLVVLVTAFMACFPNQPMRSKVDAQQDVVIAVGAVGAAEFGDQFQKWAERWEAAASGAGCGHVLLGLKPAGDDTDLERLKAELTRVAAFETSEPLWLVLIGHGTFDGRVARFNLNGADISAGELNEVLQPAKRPVVIVNCSSCSAPFINRLSGPGRIVITATKDGNEMQFSRFGDAMSEAIGDLAADLDRDGQTSLLEAWLFAVNRTKQWYESEGRLATEHSLLDDSGDGKGTRAEVFEGTRVKDTVKEKAALDGQLARKIHLVRSEDERKLTPDQRVQRDSLELQLEQLRARRGDFETEQKYLEALETALLPLAMLYRGVDDMTPSQTDDGRPVGPSSGVDPDSFIKPKATRK